jgi:WS/DGAT/MGAT family acyltransferase
MPREAPERTGEKPLPTERLTALDASFLAVETPSAHMHVGWAAVFSPPRDGAGLPTFAELRAHVASRLDRAPRYLQRVEWVPLGVHQPVWVDDDDFDVDRHFRHTVAPDLGSVVDAVMSEPLPRDRPLWQIWIADRLEDGRLGLVGKAHHCMVDGLAAVELGTMLLDPTPERGPLPRSRRFERADREAGDGWRDVPGDGPAALDLLTDGLLARLTDQAKAMEMSLRLLARPMALADGAGRMARTIAHAALPAARPSLFNGASSPRRHLARTTRPLDDLRAVKRKFETTVNDVLLAACAGALRALALERGEEPAKLKVMVPVSVRPSDAGPELGNRISFMFIELPCDEPDALVRLMLVHRDTAERKRLGEPADADAALQAMALAPRPLQRAITQLVASPRMFNLVVSNIPGPSVPLWMRGCRLEAAWPVVPLSEGHALSIGMTTVRDTACFGLYADAESFPDADALGAHLHDAIDELMAQ